MRKLITAAIASTLLAGCQSWSERIAEYDEIYSLKAGDHLVLETEILYPEGHARVKMQGYGVQGTRGINEYYPYCELEVTTVSDGQFRLHPDRFEVSSFSRRILPWNLTGTPLVVASNDPDSHSQITYVSDIGLRSDTQPEVIKLSCRHVVEPDQRDFVTFAQMQEATQGVLRFEREPR
ncbi:MAG: hypothetical protein H6981_06635 [Gammaproteobacteria bacterium]|nr:hypothetical protein [Gammaproteobacteria bacterium]MCP5136459.1 hypothetical protein [Gammaproteobacteria bacterium]